VTEASHRFVVEGKQATTGKVAPCDETPCRLARGAGYRVHRVSVNDVCVAARCREDRIARGSRGCGGSYGQVGLSNAGLDCEV
jgi:hypothetical protein